MKILGLLTVAFLVSCDGGSSIYPAKAKLDGRWSYRDGSCADLITIKGDKFTATYGCRQDGVIHAEIVSGVFIKSGNRLLLYPEKSSCGYLSGLSVGFGIDGDILFLDFGDFGVTYSRYTSPSKDSDSVFVYGCYDEDGHFIKNPVESLLLNKRRHGQD